MIRVRKLALAIAAASALSSGMANALGLGEVTLKSALNQPLVAEIELLDTRDLSASELISNLASPEEFSKAGVDRQFFLTGLKFTPVVKPNGKSVIQVTSSKPVREPYLNFLVEVLWPNGRLLREYTLLLDPPLYNPQPIAAPLQAPVAAPVAAAPRSAGQARVPAAAPRSAAPASSAPAAAPGEYRTQPNDTLWEIASRHRQGGSVHQAMLAILELNPDAFVGGNINRMKRGQVLRMPSADQVASRTQGQAVAQVAEQNAAWRDGRSAPAQRQLDATPRSVADAAPSQSASKDNLRLVSADSGKAVAGSDKGAADAKALRDKLAVTQESLDSTRRENQELTGRLGDLQSQLDKLQKLVALKDEQLAKLQADLAKQPAATPSSAPAAVTQPAVEKAAAPVAPAAPVETAPAAPAEPDFNYTEKPAEQAPAAEVVRPVEVVKPATPVQPAAPAKPVTPPPAPVAEQSWLDELLANQMLLGAAGGGALLLLLLGLMAVSRRNAQKEAELQSQLEQDAHSSSLENDLDMPESSFADAFDQGVPETDTDKPFEEAPLTPQTADALGEAEIYIAYGRFPQAAELLHNAINQEPQRSDLRLKLMEVQAELGDREGFARQHGELEEIGGVQRELEQLRNKYPAMAVGLAAVAAASAASLDAGLDDLLLDEPAAQPAADDLDDAFDISLDELEADLEADIQAAAKPADEPVDALSLDDLAFDDLQLDQPQSAPSADIPELSNSELDFALALDEQPSSVADSALDEFSLELDAPAAAQAETPVLDEDDFLLTLEDELSVSAAPLEEAPAALPAAGDDELAGLDLPADFDLSMEDDMQPEAAVADFASQLDQVSAELGELSDSLEAQEPVAEPLPSTPGLDDDEFDFLSGTDETATKLDLARAYIDMGDAEGARDILEEVVQEGSEAQQQEARELIASLT
jgi:pilus assembly protein FimV